MEGVSNVVERDVRLRSSRVRGFGVKNMGRE